MTITKDEAAKALTVKIERKKYNCYKFPVLLFQFSPMAKSRFLTGCADIGVKGNKIFFQDSPVGRSVQTGRRIKIAAPDLIKAFKTFPDGIYEMSPVAEIKGCYYIEKKQEAPKTPEKITKKEALERITKLLEGATELLKEMTESEDS